MPDCATCGLFQTEAATSGCLHVNRPGGIRLTLAALADCDLPRNAAVLDAACGGGGTLQYLGENTAYRLIGIDHSREMLSLSHHHTNIAQASSLFLPVASARVDAVMMECALSLAGNMKALLAEFWRVLRPGGCLILNDVYLRECRAPAARKTLAGSTCLGGAEPAEQICDAIAAAGYVDLRWQDETPALKTWLAGMVFRLGSLNAVYRRMVSCEEDCASLAASFQDDIKLGYYLLTARKPG